MEGRSDVTEYRLPAVTAEHLLESIGTELGVSDWMLLDQDRIDRFADVTEDRQAIHVDPEAGAVSPFGTTIAHGYLTLAMLSAMSYQLVPPIAGTTMAVNYGMNSLRFLAPVPSGSRIRGRFTLKDFAQRQPGQYRMVIDVVVDIENGARPALIAEWVSLIFVGG